MFSPNYRKFKLQPCCIDLAIARLIRHGLSLRCSHEDVTLGYYYLITKYLTWEKCIKEANMSHDVM